MPKQASNLATVIDMYQRGELSVEDEIWVKNGVVTTKQDCEESKQPYLHEVSFIQFSCQTAKMIHRKEMYDIINDQRLRMGSVI